MFDPISLLTAIIPLATDAGKAAIQRWIAPDNVKPLTVADHVAMRNADIELFKAMNDAGGSNASYPWVEAVIRLQRPFVVVCVLGGWGIAHGAGVLDTSAVDNMAAAIGFYLFADRTLFYAKKGSK
jgi:hypothetical protein